MKSFSVREICVYIERCWQHRKNKDRKTLYSHILIIIKITQEPIFYNLQNDEKSKMSHHHISDNINSFNVINVVNNYIVDYERSEILAWLSPLEHQIRHHDIQSRRIGDVGDWLLGTEEYRNWFGGIGGNNSHGSALFCYGGPGVGKTYIR